MPTDRPRTWTLEGWAYNTLSHGRITDGKRLVPGEQVRVVEWDRERVVPIIEKALAKRYGGQPESLLAEAVFDALNGEQG